MVGTWFLTGDPFSGFDGYRMFERFTDRAKKAVTLAVDCAGLVPAEPEHLLYGICAEGDNMAAHVLASMGVTADGVMLQLPARTGTVQAGVLSAHGKRVAELALREALQLGHNYVACEHLLLGIIRYANGLSYDILLGLASASVFDIRRRVIDELRHPVTPRVDVELLELLAPKFNDRALIVENLERIQRGLEEE